MTNTIVYIDVDGVINSFHESRKLTGWQGAWNLDKIMGYKIHWYTDLVEELNKLAAMENVTVKWLTTWQDQAVSELCPPLGIEGQFWDVLYHDESEGDHLFSRANGWWKLKAIIRDVAIHKPEKIVWIDDDFKYERDAIEWAEHVGNVLPISPDSDFGMTKEDFSDIVEFVNS
jgi:hypothetical protein